MTLSTKPRISPEHHQVWPQFQPLKKLTIVVCSGKSCLQHYGRRDESSINYWGDKAKPTVAPELQTMGCLCLAQLPRLQRKAQSVGKLLTDTPPPSSHIDIVLRMNTSSEPFSSTQITVSPLQLSLHEQIPTIGPTNIVSLGTVPNSGPH